MTVIYHAELLSNIQTLASKMSKELLVVGKPFLGAFEACEMAGLDRKTILGQVFIAAYSDNQPQCWVANDSDVITHTGPMPQDDDDAFYRDTPHFDM